MDNNTQSAVGGMNLRGPIILTLIMAMLALGAYTYKAFSEGRYTYDMPVTLSVTGEGEVFAKPDIATFSFGVRKEGADATAAQNASAESLNAIVEALKGMGVAEKDIKTIGYYLNPKYEYEQQPCMFGQYCPPGEQKLKGYEVSQTIEIKVRDTSKAGELISKVGELGATDISGLAFTIDDEDALKAEARKLAIAEADEKIKTLSKDLNVRVVRMTNFWEEEGGYPMYDGYGGAMMDRAMSSESAMAPTVPTGENTITVRVNVMYEVK